MNIVSEIADTLRGNFRYPKVREAQKAGMACLCKMNARIVHGEVLTVYHTPNEGRASPFPPTQTINIKKQRAPN